MIETTTRFYVEFYGNNRVKMIRPIEDRSKVHPIPAWCIRYSTFERQESKWECGIACEILKGEPRNKEHHQVERPAIEGKLARELPPLIVTAEMREIIKEGKERRARKEEATKAATAKS